MVEIAKGNYRKIQNPNRRGKRQIRICDYCGKKYEVLIWEAKYRKAKYCSLECSHKAKIIKRPKKEEFYNKYWKNKISVNQLAKEYGVSKGMIYNWMKEMQIPTRSISEAVIISEDNMTDKQKKEKINKLLNSQKSGRNYSGKRKDLGIYLRSRWEANICRYYNFIGIKWLYESKIFYFNDSLLIGKKKIKKGTLSYTPDFYLSELDIWVEVKGYLRDKSKVGLRRFKKYYPNQFKKLRFIIFDKYSKSKANGEMIEFLIDDLGIEFKDIENYKEMEKWSKLIPGWE